LPTSLIRTPDQFILVPPTRNIETLIQALFLLIVISPV
jgi:hypothetical protein